MARSKSGSRGADSSYAQSVSRRLPPPPPGEVLRTFLLAGNRITQEELARALRVSRITVNQLVNERRAITAAMALRLSRALSTSPEFWLNLQRAVDLAEAEQRLGQTLAAIKPVRPPVPENALFYDPTA